MINTSAPPGFARLVGVVGYCSGVGTAAMTNYFYAYLLTQDFQLLGGGGSESVGGAQNHF